MLFSFLALHRRFSAEAQLAELQNQVKQQQQLQKDLQQALEQERRRSATLLESNAELLRCFAVEI